MTFSQPSAAALVPLFAPYCGGIGPALEQALEQLLAQQFSGVRSLQGGGSHAYALQWHGGLAPLEATPCELVFAQQDAVRYSFSLPAHRLLIWLQQATDGDLPNAFWQWLILGTDPDA